MAPPSYRKEAGTPDGFSDRTYHPDNTYYNIELDKLRSQIPAEQATRPRSMESGYNPRYDSINNAPPSGSSRALKRVERVYATMCCGSCCGLFAWVIGSLIVVAAFIVLMVKVFVRFSFISDEEKLNASRILPSMVLQLSVRHLPLSWKRRPPR